MSAAASSSQKVLAKDSARILDVNDEQAVVSMHVPGLGVRPFLFQTVLNGAASQQKVFDKTVLDSVSAVMGGYNACILCYGQTGVYDPLLMESTTFCSQLH